MSLTFVKDSLPGDIKSEEGVQSSIKNQLSFGLKQRKFVIDF